MAASVSDKMGLEEPFVEAMSIDSDVFGMYALSEDKIYVEVSIEDLELNLNYELVVIVQGMVRSISIKSHCQA